MRYLRRGWRNESDIKDLRQEVYVRGLRSRKEGNSPSGQAFRLEVRRAICIVDRCAHEHMWSRSIRSPISMRWNSGRQILWALSAAQSREDELHQASVGD